MCYSTCPMRLKRCRVHNPLRFTTRAIGRSAEVIHQWNTKTMFRWAIFHYNKIICTSYVYNRYTVWYKNTRTLEEKNDIARQCGTDCGRFDYCIRHEFDSVSMNRIWCTRERYDKIETVFPFKGTHQITLLVPSTRLINF